MKGRTIPWLTLSLCAAMVLLHAVSELESAGAWAPWAQDADALDPRLRLVRYGARSTALVADAGEVWRLLTSPFVHTGWSHVLFNVAFFFPTAGAIESVTPRRDFLGMVLVLAASSSLFSLIWTPEISAGASGLVFGSLTAAVLVGLRHQHVLPRAMRPYLGLSVLPFLLIVLTLGFGNPSIDHACHLGGLVGGAVMGPAMRLRRAGPHAEWIPDPHVQLRLGLGLGACACALLVARPIATHGSGPAPYRVAARVELDAPPTYRPRLDTLGNVVFQGRSRLVRVAVDVVPEDEAAAPVAWALRRHVRPLTSAGLVRASGSNPAADAPDTARAAIGGLGGGGAQDACTSFHYLRREHPIQLDVCVLEVAGDVVVVSFETPREWAPKYRETRDRLLGSIRASRARA